MGTAKRWMAAALVLAWLGSQARAADFELSPAELAKVEAREIVIRMILDPGHRRGTVRAAILIDAPPAIAFEMMTRCSEALEYVPHLRVCRVRERAPDGTWEVVEHEIDFGWYAPRVKYTFRANLEADRSIDFHQVSGDFKTNEGRWEFEPLDDGARTLMRYRATIDPPSFVPNWLARSTFKRELPQMLIDLRKRCEAEQRRRARASGNPR